MSHRSGLSRVILAVEIALLLCIGVQAAQQQNPTDDQRAARAKLNEGVQAYKKGQFDEAVEDFKKAADLDPSLTNARLYLATAYASQYIPGAPADENLKYANEALQQFRIVLAHDPENISALDGIASILFSTGSSPFDVGKLNESKAYQAKHIAFRANDPEPYYWIGVIDWSIAFHDDHQMRDDWAKRTAVEIPETEPLPDTLREELRKETEDIVNDGITHIKKAIELRPDYDDAMAYLSLLYRRKAAIESDPNARDADDAIADDLVHRVQVIKEARMKQQPPPQPQQ